MMMSSSVYVHHVRRAMKDKGTKCNACGLTISVYRMEHHLNYKVDGITNCESHRRDSWDEYVNDEYEKEQV